MAKFHSYRQGSKADWGKTDDSDKLTIEQINCGAILRIADAVEKMASNVTSLIAENVRLKEQNATLLRSRRALLGINRRLKRKPTVA